MNDDKKDVLLTKEGLEKLKKEFNELTDEKRPQAVARVSRARDFGDLTENAEYSAAKEELSFIEGRIKELEEILKNVKVVRAAHTSHGHVDVGCKVTVKIDGKQESFTVVGEWEADPTSKKISHASPLGKALLGKKVGEKIEVEAPVGKLIYTILRIE